MTLSITQIIWNRLVGRLVNNKLEGTRKGKAVNSFNVSVCCWTGWVKQTKSLAMRPVSGQDLNQSLPKTNHWDCPFGQTHMKTNRAKGEKWHGESTAGLKGFVWACECVRACVFSRGDERTPKWHGESTLPGLRALCERVCVCACACVCVLSRGDERTPKAEGLLALFPQIQKFWGGILKCSILTIWNWAIFVHKAHRQYNIIIWYEEET